MSLETLESKVDNILLIMNGNGKVGLCAKVELNSDFIVREKKRRSGLVTMIIRGIVLILLAYIASRVGLS